MGVVEKFVLIVGGAKTFNVTVPVLALALPSSLVMSVA